MGRKAKKKIDEEKVSQLASRLLGIIKEKQPEDLLEKTKKAARKVLAYPGAKEVLAILGAGGLLVLAATMPGAVKIVKEIIDEASSGEWKKYNQGYLARTLRRLRKQKMVKFDFDGEKTIVRLTGLGKRKILAYSVDKIEIRRPRFWDRKWRLIIYDVPNKKRYAADRLSQLLDKLGMYRLQKSVFLCPFPCEEEVEFLREYLEIGDCVWLLTVSNFENDRVFRDYFGI